MARVVSALFLGTLTAALAGENVPSVDLTRHSVPLESVYFDTFRPTDRAVPLDRASPDLIRELRDAIPPIHEPRYEPAQQATWLRDDDVVIGYSVGAAATRQAWAYPVRILNYHEIVNDTLDREPILIAYCPLCGSGIVFSRRLAGRVLTFGNTSALHESDMVMLDYETGSYWWHVAGKAIVGTLTNERLTVLPSTTATWQEWRSLHPDSMVLSRNTGHARDYDRDPFGSRYAAMLNRGNFAFPVSAAAKDERLPPSARVLAVNTPGGTFGYPLDIDSAATFSGGEDASRYVVLISTGGKASGVYRSAASGRDLQFDVEDGVFLDRETGTRWDSGGRALEGPLEGAKLRALPSRVSFWFAIVAAEPGIRLVFQ